MHYLLFAFAIGCAIPLQAVINNQLKVHLGDSALFAALISFSVGTVVLVVLAAASGERWQSLSGAVQARPWQFMGGVLGALFVFGTMLIAPRIGVAKMLALIIAGQLLISLWLDHEGWLGLAVREITPLRAAGALLVVVGALLVNFDQLFGT